VTYLAATAGADQLAVMALLGAVGLAPLPDLDRRLPGLRHRALTHTVWFMLLSGSVGGYLGWTVGSTPGTRIGLGAFGAGVAAAGIGSHIAVDALTPAGVRLLAPLSDWHLRVGVVRSANPVANLSLLLLGTGLAVGGYALGHCSIGPSSLPGS
jgi:inner membrane protein